MKKRLCVLICISLLGMITIPNISAYSDERISVYFYFTWMNEDGSWHEWHNVSDEGYVKDQTLQVNQPIKAKIIVTSYVECMFDFQKSEPGHANQAFDLIDSYQTPPAFDIRNGEGQIEDWQSYGFKVVSPGTDITQMREEANKFGPPPEYLFIDKKFEYTWVFQANANWSCDSCSGAPLNCDFSAPWFITGDELTLGVSFANPLIRGQWTGPSYTHLGINGGGTTNGDKPSDGTSNKNTPGFEFFFMFFAVIFVCFFFSKKFSKKR